MVAGLGQFYPFNLQGENIAYNSTAEKTMGIALNVFLSLASYSFLPTPYHLLFGTVFALTTFLTAMMPVVPGSRFFWNPNWNQPPQRPEPLLVPHFQLPPNVRDVVLEQMNREGPLPRRAHQVEEGRRARVGRNNEVAPPPARQLVVFPMQDGRRVVPPPPPGGNVRAVRPVPPGARARVGE